MIELWNNQITKQEIEKVVDAINNRNISEGKVVKEFASRLIELLNTKYALLTPNGTSALTLALMGAGVGPGDEVIVPDITFIATANAAKILGAKVVVCDTEKDRPLIEYTSVLNLITDKTKAIISVHLNGRRACTKELKEAVKEKNIFVIDDACQAFMSGTPQSWMGNDADIACYSFGITKTVSTGQGGLVITKNKELFDKMQQIKLQGVDSIFECTNYNQIGFNFKMTDILASIGLGQLDRIEEKKEHEWKIWNEYKEGLKNINFIKFIPRNEEELPWMTEILCENRDRVREILRKEKIDSRPIGRALHEANYLENRGNYFNSEKIVNRFLYLPSGPDQNIDNVKKVIEILQKNENVLA